MSSKNGSSVTPVVLTILIIGFIAFFSHGNAWFTSSETERIENSAYDHGYEDGFDEGYDEGYASGEAAAEYYDTDSYGVADNNTVWIPRHGGVKYHATPMCSDMLNPEMTTMGIAIQRGFTACSNCF